MARPNPRKQPTEWETSRFPCVVEYYGSPTAEYYSTARATDNFPPSEIALFLMAQGYRVVDRDDGLISRIDRTDWQGKMASEDEVDPEWEMAHIYRDDYSNDRVIDVPWEITRFMGDSLHSDAPTRMILKSDTLQQYRNLKRQHETTAMTTTESNTQNTLPPVDEETKALALEAMPMKVVIVTFPGSDKEFSYFAPAEPGKAEPGDYCVVFGNSNPTNQQRQQGEPMFSIGVIQRETPDFEGRAKGAILGAFNVAFAKHVQARMDMLASVKARLQVKRKQFEDTAFFEMLAEKDPEARELLEQLKQFRV